MEAYILVIYSSLGIRIYRSIKSNTVQFNNLAKNRSDRMQNRFLPKYTNYLGFIKSNFGNNFYPRFNRNSNASHRFPDSSHVPNVNLNPYFNSMFKSNPRFGFDWFRDSLYFTIIHSHRPSKICLQQRLNGHSTIYATPS